MSCRRYVYRRRARKANHPAVVAETDRWRAGETVNWEHGDRHCLREDFFRELPR